MDFFKSVFSEEPPASSSEIPAGKNPETDPTMPSNSQTQTLHENANPNPKIPSVANAWTFGSTLFKTIASKSESVIGNYRQDFEEFSSGLRKETDTIRQAASRVVKDLPARLESGAAVAQTSLESVGQAIDNLGSSVSDIIIHGKDSIFTADDDDSDVELLQNSSNNDSQTAKPYSRMDAVIRAIQCDVKTYCEEPEEVGDYIEWKMGFALEENSGEIEDLLKENRVIGEIYDEIVPVKIDGETFWSRYFYRVYRVKKAEEARAKLVKRAIQGEEDEELSWDVDDEEIDNKGFISKDEGKKEIEKNEKKLESLQLGEKGLESGDDEKEIVSDVNNDGGDDEKRVVEGKLDDNESGGEKPRLSSDDKVSSEGRNDNISDFSVVSSQPSSHGEEELGWDEIEDIGSGDDESKVAARASPSRADLRKRLSAAEEEEDLTWDIEDDEHELVKS